MSRLGSSEPTTCMIMAATPCCSVVCSTHGPNFLGNSDLRTLLGARKTLGRKAFTCAAEAKPSLAAQLLPALTGAFLDATSSTITRTQRSSTDNTQRGPPGDVGLTLVADPLGFLERTQRDFGDVVPMRLAGQDVVLVASPSAVEEVLISKSDSFQKKGTAFFPGSSLAGEGLLVSDGEVWARQRRLSNPAFRQAAVGAYADAMASVTRGFLQRRWCRGGLRDVYADFNELTLEVVAETLFGADMRGPLAERITAAIKTAFEFFAGRASTGFIIPESVPTPGNIQYSAAVAELDEIVYGLIAERRAKGASASASESETSPSGDLMDRLMAARDDDGSTMGDRALRDELMTLLVAGQETSAIVLAWACHFLSLYPDLQEDVASEVASVVGDRPVLASDVPNLRLVQSVLLEAMRLRPPAYLIGRCAKEDVEIGGVLVPAGRTVLPSPYLLHRDPRHWDQPLSFNPGRWTDALEQSGGSSVRLCSGMGPGGAYVPFGAGPRNCIGAGFALLEGAVVLAEIARGFVVAPGGRFAREVKAQPVITLRPGVVELDISPRRV